MSDSEESDDISLNDTEDKLFMEEAASLRQHEDDLDLQLAIGRSLQTNHLYNYSNEDETIFPEEWERDEQLEEQIGLAIALSLGTNNSKSTADSQQNQPISSEDDDPDAAEDVLLTLDDLIKETIQIQINSDHKSSNSAIIDIIDDEINNYLSTTINSTSDDSPECGNTDLITQETFSGAINSMIDEEIENLTSKDIVPKNEFECSICLSKKNINNSGSFGCSHLYCIPCLSDFLKSKLDERSVNCVECPTTGCTAKCTERLFREYLPPDLIDKYEESIMFQNVEALEGVDYCPNCNFPVECDLYIAMGTCSKCLYTFCTSCRKDFHGAEVCEDEQSSKKRDEEIRKSEQLINEQFKKCPGCETSIEKHIIGCYHMKCAKCKTEFCWLCLIRLSSEAEIETHYRTQCILFDYNFVKD